MVVLIVESPICGPQGDVIRVVLFIDHLAIYEGFTKHVSLSIFHESVDCSTISLKHQLNVTRTIGHT